MLVSGVQQSDSVLYMYTYICVYIIFHILFIIGYYAAAAKSFQSCPTLCDPIDGRPPGSPIPGILQARTLEWVIGYYEILNIVPCTMRVGPSLVICFIYSSMSLLIPNS